MRHGATQTRNSTPACTQAGIEIAPLDLTDLAAVRALAPDVSGVVLTPILSISGPAAHAFSEGGVERGVVFSSNNVAIVGADPVYDRLRAAEVDVLESAPGWAILRPTMIYGYPGDGNLSRLLQMLSRLPRFSASWLWQGQPATDPCRRPRAASPRRWWPMNGTRQAFSPVGGPQTLSHRELVATARRAADHGGIDMPVPLGPVRALVSLLSGIGLKLPLSPAPACKGGSRQGRSGSPPRSLPGCIPASHRKKA